MSAKSDRDNRSNQLNPNNDAYWDSRRQAGDDGEEDRSEKIRRSLRGRDEPEPPEWLCGEYFMAIVAFDGRTRHVRFKTKVRNDILRSPTASVVGSVWDAQLRWMEQECKLGVAYARIAGSGRQSQKHHRFIWNSPNIQENQLEPEKARLSWEKDRLKQAEERMQAIQPGNVPSQELALFRSLASIPYNSTLAQVRNLSDTIARAEAWYSTVHDLTKKFEAAFEWEDHADSDDLGVLTEEIDFDAPNPYLDRTRA